MTVVLPGVSAGISAVAMVVAIGVASAAYAQTPNAQTPSSHTPSSQAPSSHTPSSQAPSSHTPNACEQYRGKSGPTNWRCNVIHADPKNDGPDGINLHDWDGDGDLDVFSNAEEGKYSRLYFNPGPEKVRDYWNDFIEFKHGKCEDSGIGDLDNDGDVDYIANGGWVYFNPGRHQVRDAQSWARMVLFENERRVPTVADVDGDGLNDLIVGAQQWYKQPVTGKHDASRWKRFTIGKNRWPMNCIVVDVMTTEENGGWGVIWFENPRNEAS